MKFAIATLIAIFALTLTLAFTALAAPHGNQALCPNGPPRVVPQRSATGQANACGPKVKTAQMLSVELFAA